MDYTVRSVLDLLDIIDLYYVSYLARSKADFAASSTSHSINGSTLSAICKKSNGSNAESLLELNDYLGNKYGALDLNPTEGFYNSSKKIELDGTVLKVQLQGDDGELYWSMLDLNLYVGNDEGKLTWRTSVSGGSVPSRTVLTNTKIVNK